MLNRLVARIALPAVPRKKETTSKKVEPGNNQDTQLLLIDNERNVQWRENKKERENPFTYYNTMKTNMTTIAKPLRPQMKKARRRKPLFQPFPMSDIEISITDIEKTTSDQYCPK